MNYLVLYIRLESYVTHRALKGAEVTEEELSKTTFKEQAVTISFTTLILVYPISIAIILGLHY